jgi:hypothetical protein
MTGERKEIPSEKESPGEQHGTRAENEQERSYYYDDAHGYETYRPEADKTSSGGSLDVDLDGAPPLLIEPEETEKESCNVPDQHGDPDVHRP